MAVYDRNHKLLREGDQIRLTRKSQIYTYHERLAASGNTLGSQFSLRPLIISTSLDIIVDVEKVENQ